MGITGEGPVYVCQSVLNPLVLFASGERPNHGIVDFLGLDRLFIGRYLTINCLGKILSQEFLNIARLLGIFLKE